MGRHRRRLPVAATVDEANGGPPRPLVSWSICIALFLASLALRLWLFQGLVLGDDMEEFLLAQYLLGHPVDFLVSPQLQHRVFSWLPNVLAFRVFGVSETAFFLPTWILSASLSVVAFQLLRLWKYRLLEASAGALIVATAPFEVVLGTLRANDLFLSWFLALGLWAFVALERRPVQRGVTVAVCLWLAFYAKLWAVYALPALGTYYVVRLITGAEWRGLSAFVLTSVILHGAAAAFWHERFGMWLPFVAQPGLTYPVPAEDLPDLFRLWPEMILRGSDLGTTLFGYLPFLALGSVVVKGGGMLRTPASGASAALRPDRWDVLLGVYIVTWFLLLNFVPQGFRFDRYYSIPRIFRYLAPLSLPLALLAAKLVLDVSRALRPVRRLGRGMLPLLAGVAIAINLVQAVEATSPGRDYRRVLGSVVEEITRACPPKVVIARAWLSRLMRDVYLKGSCGGQTAIVIPVGRYAGIHRARDYEQWLTEGQAEFPPGSLLMTGYFDYLYYNYDDSGFYLTGFQRPLDGRWQLVKSFGAMDPTAREPVRLWRWLPPTRPPEVLPPVN